MKESKTIFFADMPCVLATVALTTWSLFLEKHNSYVNEVFGGSLEVGDGKAFWNYIKLQRTESIGIPPLQVGDKVFYSNEGKADISKQTTSICFHSWRHLKPAPAPPKSLPSNWWTYKHSWIREASKETQAEQSCWPWSNITLGTEDLFPTMCSDIASDFYSESGILPEDWKKALFSPVYKRDDKSLPNNHRLSSLTYISCTIMEHVLCSHLSKHLEINNILTPHQHGFRKGFSTENQLISVLDDWLS